MPLESPPVWSTYLDLTADFKPWANLTNTTGREGAMTMAIDFASQWVQNYLNRPVAPTQITEYLDGWTGLDGAYQMLRYFPVIEVSSVVEYWGTNGGHTLTEQTPTNQSAQDSYQVDYLTGRLIRSFPGLIPRPWFPGSRNIVVVYTAGFQQVPWDIKIATLEFAKYWWERSQNTRQSKANDYDDDGRPNQWPGVPNMVTALLGPYRNLVIA